MSKNRGRKRPKLPDQTRKKLRAQEQQVWPLIPSIDPQIFLLLQFLRRDVSKIKQQQQSQGDLLAEILKRISQEGNISKDMKCLLKDCNINNLQITNSGQNSISVSHLDQDDDEDPPSDGDSDTMKKTTEEVHAIESPERNLTATAESAPAEETYLQESCTDSSNPIVQLTEIDTDSMASDTESESDGSEADDSVLGDTVSVDASDIDEIDDGGIATLVSPKGLFYRTGAEVTGTSHSVCNPTCHSVVSPGQLGLYQSSYSDADIKSRVAVLVSPEIFLFSLLQRFQNQKKAFSNSWKFWLSARSFSIDRPRSFLISRSVDGPVYPPLPCLDNQGGVLLIMPPYPDRTPTESEGEKLHDACTDHLPGKWKVEDDGRQTGWKRAVFDRRDSLCPVEKRVRNLSKGKGQQMRGRQYGAQRLNISKAASPDLCDPEQAKQMELLIITSSKVGSLKRLNCRPGAGHAESAVSHFVTERGRPHISNLGICLQPEPVRPCLEYGPGSQQKASQQSLEKVHNQLRLMTGAKRTNPICTKENVTTIQPLGKRWQGKTLVQIKNLPKHSIKRRLENLARSRLKWSSFVQQKHIQDLPEKTLSLPGALDQRAMPKPWENNLCGEPVISMTGQCIVPPKIQINSRGRLFTQAVIQDQYPGRSWIHVYTGMYTARSAVNAVRKRGVRVFIKFPSGETETAIMAAGTDCSVHTAGVQALKMAATLISNSGSKCQQVAFFTDTLSVLQALEENKETELLGMLGGLCQTRRVSLQWVPGHCGIPGN